MEERAAEGLIGLGASAGGLEALERFFDHAPTDAGVAYVVVMHLSRSFRSMLDELLARHTRLPVIAAEDGQPIRANSVYVIQPGTILEVSRSVLRVSSRPQVEPSGPATHIDRLFRSIASSWRHRGAAVLLSGSGADGAEGLSAVRQAGGFTGVQSPETAKFDSMPLAGLSTKAVSAVEAPEGLASAAIDGLLLLDSASRVSAPEPDGAFARILDSVVGVSATQASKYKQSTFERRVRRRMAELDVGSLDAYANLVARDSSEARALSQDLLISVTRFFRDDTPFRIIAHQVVPELLARAQEEKRPVRVWIPGCATGEEAYSIAITFAEALRDMPEKIDVLIFATDVKRDVLVEAGRGEYTAEQLEAVPEPYRDRYFNLESSDIYSVDPALRKMIVFAPHDLLGDPPFTRLDMVSCRNVLIYLSLEAQQKVLSSFAFGLLERGILVLGPSESVGALRDTFEIIDAKSRILRRTAGRVRPNLPQPNFGTGMGLQATAPRPPRRTRESALLSAYGSLLEAFAPPSLLIDANRQLLHSFGEARSYLRLPEGAAEYDVANMVDPALRMPLVTGVERAAKTRESFVFSKISTSEHPEPGQVVDLTVKPLLEPKTSGGANRNVPDKVESFLVSIVRVEERKVAEIPNVVVDSGGLARERIAELESELGQTREALQSTIEEVETTNEELQASNEELMSSNEELQSTNEELSSVNEELYSVNAEYHRQNDELSRLNAELDLLLQSTEVGVVFLDASLSITRFTSLAGKQLNLTESDIGRALSTFRSPFEDFEPSRLAREAIRIDGIVEREAVDEQGTAWLFRGISHGQGRGAVVTLINIGRLRAAEKEALLVTDRLDVVRRLGRSFYLEVAPDTYEVTDALGWRPGDSSEAEVPLLLDAVHPDDRALLVSALDGTQQMSLIVRYRGSPSDGYASTRLVGELIELDGRLRWQMVGTNVDGLTAVDAGTRARLDILDTFLECSRGVFLAVDTAMRPVLAGQRTRENLGLEVDATEEGDGAPSALPAELVAPFRRTLEGEQRESQVTLKDGTQLDLRFAPIRGPSGMIHGAIAEGIDTARWEAESHGREQLETLLVQALLDSPTATLVVDAATSHVELANAAARPRLGLLRHESLPKGVKVSRLTPQRGDKGWRDWMDGVEPGGEKPFYEVPVYDSARPVLADLSLTGARLGDRPKVVVRARVDPKRSAALEDLRERSRELAISNRDLEQFATVVSHDLRAPLRHIRHFSQSLREGWEQLESTDVNEELERIENAAIRMSGMLQGLLQYSRVGRDADPHQDVSLNACLEEAQTNLGDELAEVDLRCATLPVTRGDRTLLVQLFQNLLQNAAKYGGQKGRGCRVLVEGREEGQKVRLHFRDHGRGIAPEHAERVFQIFKRVHAGGAPGLGVGLAVCRRICELHHGSIRLDPTVTDGASFQIELPLREGS